jgi:hypothetical protein
MKNEISKLKEQYRNAKTDAQLEEIDVQMKKFADADNDAFGRAMVELIRETADKVEELTLREQISEVLPAVSLAYIAKNYFGKTRQWLYQRINGSAINGKPAKLSVEERQRLEDAFRDIGGKLSALNVAS